MPEDTSPSEEIPITIRPLEAGDVPVMRAIIAAGLREFVDQDRTPACSESTVAAASATDDSKALLDGFPEAFETERSRYLVATRGDRVLGGGGFAPRSAHEAELQKMYLAPAARGQGIGRALLSALLDHAGRLGFATIELETATAMHAARHLYTAMGFVEVLAQSGTCGKTPCDRRFRLELSGDRHSANRDEFQL